MSDYCDELRFFLEFRALDTSKGEGNDSYFSQGKYSQKLWRGLYYRIKCRETINVNDEEKLNVALKSREVNQEFPMKNFSTYHSKCTSKYVIQE